MTRVLLCLPLVALLLASSAASCSKKTASSDDAGDAAPPIASCDRVSQASVCSEYSRALLAKEEPAVVATCARLNGTFAQAGCPHTNLLGACSLVTGEARRYYSTGEAAYTIESAKKECEGPYAGVWAAFQ